MLYIDKTKAENDIYCIKNVNSTQHLQMVSEHHNWFPVNVTFVFAGTLSSTLPGMGPVERAQALKRELLERVEALGSYLPNNMLDELIDALGGPDNVAEVSSPTFRGTCNKIYSDSNGNFCLRCTRAKAYVIDANDEGWVM